MSKRCVAFLWIALSADIGLILADPPPAERLSELVAPFLTTYCVGCHGADDAQAGLRLDELPAADRFLEDRTRWMKVVAQLRARGMPPKDEEQPSDEDRSAVADWIAQAADAIDCGRTQPVGRPTIRRLNRFEYNNTVRDLLGIDFRPADDFPRDDVGEGFDNIGDVLSLSPLLFEKYLDAADKIADRAIVLPRPVERRQWRLEAEEIRSSAGGGRTEDQKAQIMARNGEIYKVVSIPRDGDYIVRVQAFGRQAGDEPTRAVLRIDKNDVQTLVIDASDPQPGTYEHTVSIKEGKRRIALAFVNALPADAPAQRQLIIDAITIDGPVRIDEPPKPGSHDRLLFLPLTGEQKESNLRAVIGRLARRAFRRPVEEAEIDRLIAVYRLAEAQSEPPERGMQLALMAVLVSPHFLFKVEGDDAADIEPKRLSPHELAVRLSYFLWSSMPDEELSAAADSGQILEPAVLEAHVDRMLADDKVLAFVENFAGQWLQLRNLDDRSPDHDKFPSWGRELRSAMRRETELFFAAILRERKSVVEFLTADYTFVNEKLARHYGIEGVAGEEFQRVSTVDQPRGGILTQASILTLTSDPTRTSPVKRGKWVLDTILGAPPAVPPPDVPELDQQQLTGTLRQRMEQHRANPACATCHAEMDPLGFGLENFNAIGAWRDKDGDYPIDASGSLPDGSTFNGPRELAMILAKRKDEFVRALAEKMLIYSLGRGLEYYDRCEVNRITEAVNSKNGQLASMVHEIVQGRPFQYRGPSPGGQTDAKN